MNQLQPSTNSDKLSEVGFVVSSTVFITVVAMVLVVVLATALALLLVQDFRGKWVVRFLVLLPWTTPVSLATIAWLWLLDSLFSPIDWTLRQLGLLHGNLHWLGNSQLATASVIAVHTWRIVPLAAVIVLAGLVAIPDEVNEAARVDGAGFWRTLWEITIPLTRPVMAVAVLFGAILVFTDMAVVYVLTRTSNPSAGTLQDLAADGALLHERVARWVAERWPGGRVGLVVGATRPQELRRLRELVPGPGFLVPGVGAQGGELDAAIACCHGTDAPGLVNLSRAIANASSGDDWQEAAGAAAAQLRARMFELGATLGR